MTRDKLVRFYEKFALKPEQVAKAVVRAVRRNKANVPIGPDAWFLWLTKRFSQTLFESMMHLSARVVLEKPKKGKI